MRYKFNMESMAREKVNTHFSFPIHINMGKYTETFLVGDNTGPNTPAAATGVAPGGPRSTAASSTVDSSSSQLEELNYELIGVTVHTGAAESGHYYCFVRDRSYPQSDVWYVIHPQSYIMPQYLTSSCFC